MRAMWSRSASTATESRRGARRRSQERSVPAPRRPKQTAVAWIAALGLSACYEPPGLTPLVDSPTLIVKVEKKVDLGDLHPADLMPLPGGEIVVLDSYRSQLQVLGADLAIIRSVEGRTLWGEPTRFAPSADGGFWVINPKGWLVRTDEWGEQLESVELAQVESDTAPVFTALAAVEQGPRMLVSDREGRLAWVERATGAVELIPRKATEADGMPGVFADLSLLSTGRIAAVDATGTKIRLLDPTGAEASVFGRFGMWAGTLAKPKSLAEGPASSLLVADTELKSIQAFSAKGVFLGLVSDEAGPLDLAWPAAIRAAPDDPGHLFVLDNGTIWELRLEETAVKAAQARPVVRSLRKTLVEDQEGREVAACEQCHAGLLKDGRVAFDPMKNNHPMGEKIERELPEEFPLTEDGAMNCGTCHSPHDDGPQGDELCQACHGETPHEDPLSVLTGAGGTSHPTGAKLARQLAEWGEDPTKGGCLGCHAPHGTTRDKLVRSPDQGGLCLACHEDHAQPEINHPLELKKGQKGPRPRPSADIQLSSTGGLSCESCHALVGGTGKALLKPPHDGGLLCTACHEDKKVLQKGGHRNMHAPNGTPCLACHDIHGEKKQNHFLISSKAASTGDPSGCLACHSPRGKAARAGVSPGAQGHPVGVKDSKDKTLTCETCHDAHDPSLKGDKGCGDCHSEQKAAQTRGGHGNTTCLSCHPAHQRSPIESKKAGLNPRTAACLSCHAAEAGRGDAPRIASYEHPAPVFDMKGRRWTPLAGLTLYNARGEPAGAGANGDLTCSSCHLTHGPDSDQTRDSLRRGGWQTACSSCHGDDALPLYRYFHKPELRADLGVSR